MKSLFPILIAVVLGLAAAVFAQSWMKSRIAAAEADTRGGVTVLVANTDIAFGEQIKAESVKTATWPRSSVPDEALRAPADAVGKIANQRMVAGEVILRQRVSLEGGGSSLAAKVEPNKRAVTVRVNDVIGVAGFLLPGNRVDVLATRMIENTHRAETSTLLQNVKVLAVDQTAQTEKDQPVVVRVVTLEIDPSQAVDLARATEEGTVQLALRNPDDRGVVAAADDSQMMVASAAPQSAPAPVRASHHRHSSRSSGEAKSRPEPAPSISVIRGAQVGSSPVVETE